MSRMSRGCLPCRTRKVKVRGPLFCIWHSVVAGCTDIAPSVMKLVQFVIDASSEKNSVLVIEMTIPSSSVTRLKRLPAKLSSAGHQTRLSSPSRMAQVEPLAFIVVSQPFHEGKVQINRLSPPPSCLVWFSPIHILG
jgi:hypothetical protein